VTEDTRYRIEQAPDQRWYIVSNRDEGLIWCGSHWGYPDQGTTPLIGFADRDQAEHYANVVLGGGE
jgi:hypothetical protein